MRVYAATVASVALLASIGRAWEIAIYDRFCHSENMRYYVVIGQGHFEFIPWQGPPWNGYIEDCSYFFDGGRQGPFPCTGRNDDFIAQWAFVRKEEGNCMTRHEGGGRSINTGECADITAWGPVQHIECWEHVDKKCAINPYHPECPDTEGGNTHVDMSDEAVNFGTVHPKDAFEKLLETCTTVGCNGDNKAEIETRIVEPSRFSAPEYTIKISAEASFNPTKQATRENMVDILRQLADKATDAREVTYHNNDPTNIKHFTKTQYYLSQEIHMKTSQDGETAHLNVRVEVVEDENEDGFCEKIFAAAGAIGGVVNGYVGGAFGLAVQFYTLPKKQAQANSEPECRAAPQVSQLSLF
ncbi:hypothetical protein HJFPF1_12355 [Paramyrothecium foliicola]|nr:hypothetical protein HJFPF1_12355 [Paramyrothecium foliicola]